MIFRRRSCSALILLLALASARGARAGDVGDAPRIYAAGFDAGVGIGVLFATHGRLGLSAGVTLFEHLDLEASLRFGGGSGLIAVEPTLRAGVLLRVAPRWRLLFGARVGYASIRTEVPSPVADDLPRRVWTGALALGLSAEIRWAITPELELRAAPLGVTGYWNEIWGLVVDPTIGCAYRF